MAATGDDMQFSDGEQNSVDIFEKQFRQQELELQSQLREQEEEESRKSALEKVAIPTPVAQPEGWTNEMSNGGTGADEHETTGVSGLKRSSPVDDEPNGGDPKDSSPPAKKGKQDEMAKLWASVNENPKDFQAWTNLLQHVDQQSELEGGREAYSSFFERYPYCYGYWKKFADLEKRKGTKESTAKVFERGLLAIPLSVDLWVHYLDYIVNTFTEDEHERFVRQQFERAVQSCGLEFRSDKMWDAYANWEANNKRWQRVTSVYDRVLATPVAKYLQHWTKFQDHIKRHPITEVISAEEFLAMRRSLTSPAEETGPGDEATGDGDEAPPGVEDDPAASSDSAAVAAAAVTTASEEESKNIQELVLSSREKLHTKTSEEVKSRWSYEDAIKRPYFHVKPLERSQLQAWRDYLEYEVKRGNEQRTRTLFERCLIAAALYEEFWMRYIHYLETLSTVTDSEMRNVFERACNIHLKDKIRPHLSWATFEEEQGDFDRALQLLSDIRERLPDALEPHLQAAGIERRRGNLDKAEETFKNSIELFKTNGKGKITQGYSNLVIKYARFLALFRQDNTRAVDVLQSIIDDFNSREDDKLESELQCMETLMWALVERSLGCFPPNFGLAAQTLKFGSSSNFPPRSRMMFAHRYQQFVTECGSSECTVSEASKVVRLLQQELRQMEAANEACAEGGEKTDGEDEKGNKKNKSGSGGDKNSQAPPHGHNQQNGNNYPNQNYGNNGQYQQYPPQGGNTGGSGGGSHQHPHPPPPQQQGYGNYNQNYQQGYPPQQYQGWGYPQQQQPQQGYGYNQQQNWSGYPNYYGQR